MYQSDISVNICEKSPTHNNDLYIDNKKKER